MSLRQLRKSRAFTYGSGSVAAILIVAAVLTILALLGERYSWRLDATKDQSQSLTTITKNLLQEVKEPLKLTAFYPETAPDRQTAKELLDNYAYANRLITVSLVDPERQPLEAKKAGFRYPGNVLVEYGGKQQLATAATEDQVTQVMRRLLHPETKKVYFLTGHGERGFQDAQGGYATARQSLENGGLTVAELNLAAQGGVPADATLVVIAGPEKPLFPAEIQALKDFLNTGGRVLALFEPYKDAGLKDLVASYGIELDDRMILDVNQVSRALGASATMPMVIHYGAHRITQDLTNVMTLFPLARPLTILENRPKNLQVTPLATTTATSWVKKGQEWLKSGKAEFDPAQDKRGPFTLAALAEKKLGDTPAAKPPAPGAVQPPEKAAYLAVFGDVDFADNRYFNISGNGDLFLNTVNFLAAEETQITLRSKAKTPQPLILTGAQGWLLLLVALVILPLGMGVGGLRAYLRRRTRR